MKDINETIENDKKMQEGIAEFQQIIETATPIAEDIASDLVEQIVKNKEKFNVTTAIVTLAKALTMLSSYLYDSEGAFMQDVEKARQAVPSVIIPALLDPQPCGICEECKAGRPEDCINPKVNADRTTSRFLPILCNMIIEYDLFNKLMYMYTAGREEEIDSRLTAGKEPEAPNGETDPS